MWSVDVRATRVCVRANMSNYVDDLNGQKVAVFVLFTLLHRRSASRLLSLRVPRPRAVEDPAPRLTKIQHVHADTT